MSVISMKQLLEAGVHFGHQTRRWNPKMAPYIFTERNGIYIIDLQKSVGKVDEAYKAVADIAAQGGTVLFVGTKKQAQDAVFQPFQQQGIQASGLRILGDKGTFQAAFCNAVALGHNAVLCSLGKDHKIAGLQQHDLSVIQFHGTLSRQNHPHLQNIMDMRQLCM